MHNIALAKYYGQDEFFMKAENGFATKKLLWRCVISYFRNNKDRNYASTANVG